MWSFLFSPVKVIPLEPLFKWFNYIPVFA